MKTVILSFDDARQDFYTNVFPLLKKYRIPATLNVISDFVLNPQRYSYPSGDNKSMTVEQVKECAESGLVEIACHGHTHDNTRKDVEENIGTMRSWGIDTQRIGFASPFSNLTWSNKNDNGIWDLVKEHKIAYVRSGLQIRREGMIYTCLSLLDRFIHSKFLFKILNTRTLPPSYINQSKCQHADEPFFLSTAIYSYTAPRQIKYFIDHVASDSVVILMLHSVIKRNEPGYGADKFYYDFDRFVKMLDFLKNDSQITFYTTMDYVKNQYFSKV